MFEFFQNIMVTIFGLFFSLWSALLGIPWGGEEIEPIREFPAMTLHTEFSQGEGAVVNLAGYPGEDEEDPAFLAELLEWYSPEPFAAEAGERAEAQIEQEAGVYSLGWGDHPADIALWRITSDGSLERRECDELSVFLRFNLLQMTFTLPEEPGEYLLTVHENYNIGPALHLIRFTVGETGDTVRDDEYQPPQTYDFEEAKARGYVVVTESGVENAAVLDQFIQDWADGKDSSVYLIKEGKQGKPLATLFLSRDGRIIAYNDYTQIGGEVFQKEYKTIYTISRESGLSYYVTDWEGELYLLFELERDVDPEATEYGGIIVASTPREDGVTYLIYGSRTEREWENTYINIFVDSQTQIVRAGDETEANGLRLGDDIAVVPDLAYQAQTPNTVRAALVWAVPGGAAA